MRYRLSGAAAAAALVLLAACDDRTLVGPGGAGPGTPPAPAGAVVLQCEADVAAGSVRCARAPQALPAGLSADRIVGGQDLYVQLSSTGTSYDAGSEVFGSTVTVQNLTRHLMGTPDGFVAEGVRVFFHQGPTVTSGAGTVTLLNADGVDAFTGSEQPYFEYGEILAPMEISDGRRWEFSAPPSVGTFVFLVYVSAPMIDEASPLLGPVWTGAGPSPDWSIAANWSGGEVPDSAVATVPSDSVLGGAPHPVLGADATVRHLRVGTGSTLDLGGNVIEVLGNVDARGVVANGTVRLVPADSGVAGGTLPAVEVAGEVQLQRPTTATGAVRVTGALSIDGVPLAVRVP